MDIYGLVIFGFQSENIVHNYILQTYNGHIYPGENRHF
jgi:hypothetical protein